MGDQGKAPSNSSSRAKQETKQASKRQNRKEKRAREEEEEREPVNKRRKHRGKKRSKTIQKDDRDQKRGPKWRTGTVVNTPRQWWLKCGLRRGSGSGSCSPPLSRLGGVRPRVPPQPDPPPLCAHTGGGGKPANVWWWDHGQWRRTDAHHGVAYCWGSGTKRGRIGGQMEPEGAWEPKKKNKGKRSQKEAGKDGSGMLMGKGRRKVDAEAMQGRRIGEARTTRGPNPCSRMDEEVTQGGKGGGGRRTMRLCSLTSFYTRQGWLTKNR